MGTFAVRFVVSHPRQPERRVELEGLVDSGALFTQIPEQILAGIGIVPSGSRAVHYADGTGAVVPVAKADIAIHGVETATMILYGRPKSLVLLGATTLETLGLGIDPIHKKLIAIDAPMAATSSELSGPTSAESDVVGRCGRVRRGAEEVVDRQTQIGERGGGELLTACAVELVPIAFG